MQAPPLTALWLPGVVLFLAGFVRWRDDRDRRNLIRYRQRKEQAELAWLERMMGRDR